MRTVRILISSPLDVAEERQKARLVIESLERYYERLAKIEVVMFEDLATSVDESVQESIAKVLSEKSGINIAVFILWSRLGSELSEENAQAGRRSLSLRNGARIRPHACRAAAIGRETARHSRLLETG